MLRWPLQLWKMLFECLALQNNHCIICAFVLNIHHYGSDSASVVGHCMVVYHLLYQGHPGIALHQGAVPCNVLSRDGSVGAKGIVPRYGTVQGTEPRMVL